MMTFDSLSEITGPLYSSVQTLVFMRLRWHTPNVVQ